MTDNENYDYFFKYIGQDEAKQILKDLKRDLRDGIYVPEKKVELKAKIHLLDKYIYGTGISGFFKRLFHIKL